MLVGGCGYGGWGVGKNFNVETCLEKDKVFLTTSIPELGHQWLNTSVIKPKKHMKIKI